MGKKKSSSSKKNNSAKKGKKACRKLSTEDIDDFNEKATKDALTGGSLSSIPSDSLFYVDKSTDEPLKRKIEKTREKVLHYESVLQKNPFVKPVPYQSTKKKIKKKKQKLIEALASFEDVPKEQENNGSDSGMVDLWDKQDEDNTNDKKKAKPSEIAAVEIDPPGCSYNPEPESHKDSLAHAVADEMKKIYQNELGPQPIPLIVNGEAINEEDRLFIDADGGSEDEMDEESPNDTGDASQEKRPSETKRLTRVELNRRARRKEMLKAETEAKKLERISKEIDSIPDILKEIAEEEEEKHKKNLRRIVAKQERRKQAPPRLGKRKFEPAPTQVLLSEEITGSLRQLKACCTLARDRFKSLEKRGLIVPSTKKIRKQ